MATESLTELQTIKEPQIKDKKSGRNGKIPWPFINKSVKLEQELIIDFSFLNMLWIFNYLFLLFSYFRLFYQANLKETCL